MIEDGRVLTPGQIERDLHRELLEWRQAEARAQQAMRRIKAELMLLMQTASRLDGIVVWESRIKPTFEEARFKRENPTLASHTSSTSTSGRSSCAGECGNEN